MAEADTLLTWRPTLIGLTVSVDVISTMFTDLRSGIDPRPFCLHALPLGQIGSLRRPVADVVSSATPTDGTFY